MEDTFCDVLVFFGVCLVLLTCRSMLSKPNPLDRESYFLFCTCVHKLGTNFIMFYILIDTDTFSYCTCGQSKYKT